MIDFSQKVRILWAWGSDNQTRYITVDDDIICTEKIIADRKTFFIDLKSNARGRVVRITEKVSSNRDRIMVPAEILDDFIAALEDIRRANQEHWRQQGIPTVAIEFSDRLKNCHGLCWTNTYNFASICAKRCNLHPHGLSTSLFTKSWGELKYWN